MKKRSKPITRRRMAIIWQMADNGTETTWKPNIGSGAKLCCRRSNWAMKMPVIENIWLVRRYPRKVRSFAAVCW